MRLLLLLLIGLGLHVNINAQTQQRFNVYFPTNSYQLSLTAQATIDSVVNVLTNIPQAYKVELTGHTDNVGSNDYNLPLSQNRAQEVGKYLMAKGFKKVKYEGLSFNNPVADYTTEEGKLLNRTVEIAITLNLPAMADILPQTKPTVYTFKAEDGFVSEQPSGTTLIIPAGAFTDADGNEVKGNVSLAYTEYREPVDFIFSDIPMSVPMGDTALPFNSGGMFEMKAEQNGKELKVKAGKQIKLDFAATDNLPNMNFYKFENGKWVEVKKLVDNKGKKRGGGLDDILWYKAIPHCGQIGTSYLYYDTAEAYSYVANMGEALASSPLSLQTQLKQNDDLLWARFNHYAHINDMQCEKEVTDAVVNSLKGQIRLRTHAYTIKQVKKNDKKIVYAIRCKQSWKNEFFQMNKVVWEYDLKTNPAINAADLQKVFTACNITLQPGTGLYTATFVDSFDKVTTVNNLQIAFTKGSDKKNMPLVPRMMECYRVTLKNYHTGMAQTHAQFDSAWHKQDALCEELRTARAIKIDEVCKGFRCLMKDSVFTFWKLNKRYMGADEKKMDFNEWVAYFDASKPQMAARYAALKKAPEYPAYARISERLSEQRKQSWRTYSNNGLNGFMTIGGFESRMVDNEDLQVTKDIFQSLSVDKMGVFNCDQIARLQAPIVRVEADYTDEAGKPVDILLVYVVDKSLNGILRYDGTLGNGPRSFAFSGASNTTLIAFDENFNPYIFTPDKFKAAQFPSTQVQYTFQLQKLDKIKDKDSLRAVL